MSPVPEWRGAPLMVHDACGTGRRAAAGMGSASQPVPSGPIRSTDRRSRPVRPFQPRTSSRRRRPRRHARTECSRHPRIEAETPGRRPSYRPEAFPERVGDRAASRAGRARRRPGRSRCVVAPCRDPSPAEIVRVTAGDVGVLGDRGDPGEGGRHRLPSRNHTRHVHPRRLVRARDTASPQSLSNEPAKLTPSAPWDCWACRTSWLTRPFGFDRADREDPILSRLHGQLRYASCCRGRCLIARTRREGTPEFERETVFLLESSGQPRRQSAAERGIQPSMLRPWPTARMGGSPPS